MFFTQDDFKKIEEWLRCHAIRDTQFPIGELTDDDEIPIIDDGNRNARISVYDFIKHTAAKAGYINYHEYVKDNTPTTLEEAVSLIELKDRNMGTVLTFISTPCNKWVSYQFIGELSLWEDISKWEQIHEFKEKYEVVYSTNCKDFDGNIEKEYADRAERDALGNVIHDTYVTRRMINAAILEGIQLAIPDLTLPDNSITLDMLTQQVIDYIGSGGNVVNNPDEEDLTVKNNQLKFADKQFNRVAFSGDGRVYLRKNLSNGLNVLLLEMILLPNTRYIVQYDFCLLGRTLVVPENSTIIFEGGTINNGTLVLNNTRILPNCSSPSEYGTATIEGTYKEGLIIYDKLEKIMKLWNGTEWVSLTNIN